MDVLVTLKGHFEGKIVLGGSRTKASGYDSFGFPGYGTQQPTKFVGGPEHYRDRRRVGTVGVSPFLFFGIVWFICL